MASAERSAVDSPAQPSEVATHAEAKSTTRSLVQQCFVDMLRPTTEMLQEVQEEVQELQRGLAQLRDQAVDHTGRLDRHEEEIPVAERLLKEEMTKVDRRLEQQRGRQEELEAAQRAHEAELAHVQQRLEEETSRLQRDVEMAQQELTGLEPIRADIADYSRHFKEIEQKCSFLEELNEGVNARQLEIAKDVQAVRSEGQATDVEVKRLAKETKQQFKEVVQPIPGLAVRIKDVEDAIRSTKCDLLSQTAALKEQFPPLKMGIDELCVRQDNQIEAHERLAKQQLEARQLAEGIQPQIDELLSRIKLSDSVIASAREEIQPVRDQVQHFGASIAKNRHDIEELASTRHPERFDELEKQGQELSEKLIRQHSQHETLVESAQETRDRLEYMISQVEGMEAQRADARLQLVEGRAKQTAEVVEALELEIKKLESSLGPIAPELSRLGHRIELAHEHMSGLVSGVEEARRKIHAGEDDMIPLKAKTRKLPSLHAPQRASVTSPDISTPSARTARPGTSCSVDTMG